MSHLPLSLTLFPLFDEAILTLRCFRSFFENWDQTCAATESCQENMVSIECSPETYIWGLSTKAATNMLTLDGQPAVKQADNRDNFCSTIALFESA